VRLLAVLANLFLWPGVGHFLLGRYVRGGLWIVVTLGCILAGSFALILVPIGLLAPRALSAIDAGVMRTDLRPFDSKVVPVLAFLCGLGGVGILLLLMVRYYLEAYLIPTGGMLPTLAIGDYVLADKLAYRSAEPKRGEVVAFTSPCDPDSTLIKRVVGLPGDTIEVRCELLFVNGKLVPQRLGAEYARYWERDGEEWQEEAASRFVEQLDEQEYQVFLGLDRPDMTRRRAEDKQASYSQLAGPRDFPGAELPSCQALTEEGIGDQAAPPGPALGRIEDVAPAAGAGPCGPQRRYVVPDAHLFVIGDHRPSSSDSRQWGPLPVANVVGKVFGVWFSQGPPAEGIRWNRIGGVD
jgi:signal peptidase I